MQSRGLTPTLRNCLENGQADPEATLRHRAQSRGGAAARAAPRRLTGRCLASMTDWICSQVPAVSCTCPSRALSCASVVLPASLGAAGVAAVREAAGIARSARAIVRGDCAVGAANAEEAADIMALRAPWTLRALRALRALQVQQTLQVQQAQQTKQALFGRGWRCCRKGGGGRRPLSAKGCAVRLPRACQESRGRQQQKCCAMSCTCPSWALSCTSGVLPASSGTAGAAAAREACAVVRADCAAGAANGAPRASQSLCAQDQREPQPRGCAD
jgi:hypothetical protein